MRKLSNRPAGKALLEYGVDLNVEKFGDALGDVDNEFEALRKVEKAANDLVVECKGGIIAPSLGVLACLEVALHSLWKERQQ